MPSFHPVGSVIINQISIICVHNLCHHFLRIFIPAFSNTVLCYSYIQVRREYQSKIDSFLCKPGLDTIHYGRTVYKVSRRESGPATTLVIKNRSEVVTTIAVVTCVAGTVLAPRCVYNNFLPSRLWPMADIKSP